MLFRYPLVVGEVANKAPNQKLGTVAVALLGWVAWAEATGSRAEDERIRKMAQYVLSQSEPNGKFQAYLVDPQHRYYNNKNDIVPGEAALALGEVAEYFGEDEWLEFFSRFLDYYEPWFRTRAERKNPYGRWPHKTYDNNTRLDLVQFGPWSVMANKQYYSIMHEKDPEAAARAAAFGLEVADWMIDNYQWSTLLRALNAASIDDAADALLAKLDVDGDGRVSLDEFQRGFDILSAHDQLRVDPIKGLAPHDFTGLWHEKHAAHLLGTREWAFAEIGAWLDEPDASQLFWLMCVGTREAARGRPL